MREPGRGNAVRVATDATFEQGVTFAEFEARLGRDVPSVRGQALGERVLRVALLLAYCAPVVALLAALNLPGALGRTSPGIVPWTVTGQPFESFVLVCFVLALSGQTWALLSWWHLGRRRSLLDLAASGIALVVGILYLTWMSDSPPIGRVFPETLNAAVVTTVLLAALALGAQLFASRPGSQEQARASARGQLLRVLPQAQQQSLLAERREVLDVLLERGVVDQVVADQAAALPLGDWWCLDVDESVEDARRAAPHSLVNTTMAHSCLKAVTLVVPFGMVLLPIGNPGISGGGGMRSIMQSEGMRGDTLVMMAMLCAVLGIIGQVWTIFDWWRLGRRREGLWLGWSWTALVCSVATLVIFPFFLTGSWGMKALTGPILAVAVSAAVALVAMYAASVPGTVLEVRTLGWTEDPETPRSRESLRNVSEAT